MTVGGDHSKKIIYICFFGGGGSTNWKIFDGYMDYNGNRIELMEIRWKISDGIVDDNGDTANMAMVSWFSSLISHHITWVYDRYRIYNWGLTKRKSAFKYQE